MPNIQSCKRLFSVAVWVFFCVHSSSYLSHPWMDRRLKLFHVTLSLPPPHNKKLPACLTMRKKNKRGNGRWTRWGKKCWNEEFFSSHSTSLFNEFIFNIRISSYHAILYSRVAANKYSERVEEERERKLKVWEEDCMRTARFETKKRHFSIVSMWIQKDSWKWHFKTLEEKEVWQ
jgi:hypothetical protein